MELTHEEELQAYSDALGALLIALGRQLDTERLLADLRRLADQADAAGHGPSAALIDTLVAAGEAAFHGRPAEH